MTQPRATSTEACAGPFIRSLGTSVFAVFQIPHKVGPDRDRESSISLLKKLQANGFLTYELISLYEREDGESLLNSCFFTKLKENKSAEQVQDFVLGLANEFQQPALIIGSSDHLTVFGPSGQVLESTREVNQESLARLYRQHLLVCSALGFIGFRRYDGFFAKWGSSAVGLQMPPLAEPVTEVTGRWE